MHLARSYVLGTLCRDTNGRVGRQLFSLAASRKEKGAFQTSKNFSHLFDNFKVSTVELV